jgi:coenzyme F420 hydrogenase subunit beta
MSGRPKIFGHLIAEVIRKDKCVACGTCVALCPVGAIAIEDGPPKLVGQCIACGMCYANCPRAVFDTGEMETQVFSRARSEEEADLGVHSAIYAVRAKDPEVLKTCQDGGAVSALLSQFLSDVGDGAVVAGLDMKRVWAAKPVVASSKNEMLDAAGTKYTSSPTLLGVSSAALEYGKKKIAVVGTPCQMRGLRKLESGVFSNKKISDAIDLRVGLFCMETFDYKSFMEYLVKEGVDASKVDKFEIKSGKFIAREGDKEVHNVKLSKVKELVRSCCHICDDFSSEFADISVGNVGSPDGWSTVIIRTKRGEDALMAAERSGLVEVKPVEEGKAGTGIIKKLAQMKKDAAKKSLEEKAS